jgi:rRNA pseudouridine-1189 N-methylase Emg1 (Nep1/Mra1 family)
VEIKKAQMEEQTMLLEHQNKREQMDRQAVYDKQKHHHAMAKLVAQTIATQLQPPAQPQGAANANVPAQVQ